MGQVEELAQRARSTGRVGVDTEFMGEGRYRALVLDFYRRHVPDPANPDRHHGETAGASLALTRQAHETSGGFRPLATGEDTDLVRRLKSAGRSVRHAPDVVVRASCRLDGRAEGGELVRDAAADAAAAAGHDDGAAGEEVGGEDGAVGLDGLVHGG